MRSKKGFVIADWAKADGSEGSEPCAQISLYITSFAGVRKSKEELRTFGFGLETTISVPGILSNRPNSDPSVCSAELHSTE